MARGSEEAERRWFELKDKWIIKIVSIPTNIINDQ